MSLFSIRTLILGLTVVAVSSVAAQSDWSQWRGPNRDGKIASAEWPNSLGSYLLTKQWSVDLAEGYASPVVSDSVVISVETRGKREEVVRAFERSSGKQLWEHVAQGAMKVPFFAAKNGSWARSTPATDGEFVYVLSMVDVLTCLEVETGRVIWELDFKTREGTGVPSFGGVSSPMIDGDFLYVQGGSAATKLERSSSKNLWRVMEDRRGMFGGSFCFEVDKRADGFIVEMLWRDKRLEGYMSSPVAIDGYLYHHGRDKKLHCLNFETGEVKWVSERKFGDYWSMVVNGSKVLALDQNGTLLLFNASPTSFNVLDERSISEDPTWAHLAVSGEQLFVRSLKGMSAYSWIADS